MSTEVIYFNKHRYPQFSNFYNSPLYYKGIRYENSEAAFQAAKVLDDATRIKFSTLSGAEAKKLGRSVKLRDDWETIKYSVMVDVVYNKFAQHNDLVELLLSTGDAKLVEDTTSWHDNTWGNCSCPKCAGVVGQNWLGLALMAVRDRLRKIEG